MFNVSSAEEFQSFMSVLKKIFKEPCPFTGKVFKFHVNPREDFQSFMFNSGPKENVQSFMLILRKFQSFL